MMKVDQEEMNATQEVKAAMRAGQEMIASKMVTVINSA
jgi:hypothetical protein